MKKTPTSNLTHLYLFFFSITALLISLGFAFAYNSTLSSIDDSRIVNIAGRQRMLSQRLSKDVVILTSSSNNSNNVHYRMELEEAIEQWSRAEEGLQYGDSELGLPGNNSSEVKQLFFSIEDHHSNMLLAASRIESLLSDESFIYENEKAKLKVLSSQVLRNEEQYLIKMDKIVFQLDSEAKQRIENGLRSLTTTTLLLLIAIAGQALFIFRPVIKKVVLLDKAKTEFISLASHQLRTPLSAVNWYTEMILNGDAGKISAKQKEYLNEIYSSNQRMVTLVNALLNVSRLELGTFSVDPKSIDIVETLETVFKEFEQLITTRNQVLKNIHEDVPKIISDPKLVSIIFHNLLSNAIKYTPNKGVITTNVYMVKKGTKIGKSNAKFDGIGISISDTGYGIPKNQHDKIFTKLFRADNIKKNSTEGTGLGLYIVKSIVDQFGGMIWFDSKIDKGTTFYVVLPLEGIDKKIGTTELNYVR